MTNDNEDASHIYFKSNFFDGMPNNFGKLPEEGIKKREVRIGEKLTQDGKDCIVVATAEEPNGYIIPDKYYCVIKEIITSKKFFLKL